MMKSEFAICLEIEAGNLYRNFLFDLVLPDIDDFIFKK